MNSMMKCFLEHIHGNPMDSLYTWEPNPKTYLMHKEATQTRQTVVETTLYTILSNG